jgi:hypothetical protein
VKIFLANPEPSTHCTKQTWLDVRDESVMRIKADIEYAQAARHCESAQIIAGGDAEAISESKSHAPKKN